MLSATHKLIAEKVYEAIASEFDFNVDMNSLCKGSMAPDFSPSMMFMPHSIEGSIAMVEETMNGLCSGQAPYDIPDIKRFSYKLGLILHFVSDYFCKAHNDKRYDNLFLHFIYERNLKIFFKKKLAAMSPAAEGSSSVFHAKRSLGDHIRYLHQEYNQVKRSMTNDFRYSLTASTYIARRIISCALENSNSASLRETA